MNDLNNAAESFAKQLSNDEVTQCYIQGAFKFGATWQKDNSWHDLRKDKNDLPETRKTVLGKTIDNTNIICRYSEGSWSNLEYDNVNIIGWLEIPEF